MSTISISLSSYSIVCVCGVLSTYTYLVLQHGGIATVAKVISCLMNELGPMGDASCLRLRWGGLKFAISILPNLQGYIVNVKAPSMLG